MQANQPTTAQLRDAARKAASDLQWDAAALLYDAAADAYPNPNGALCQADIAGLRELAGMCRRAAKHQGKVS